MIKKRQSGQDAYERIMAELHVMRLRVIALNRRLRQEIGPAAYAAFETDFAETVRRETDADNVVRLRRRMR